MLCLRFGRTAVSNQRRRQSRRVPTAVDKEGEQPMYAEALLHGGYVGTYICVRLSCASPEMLQLLHTEMDLGNRKNLPQKKSTALYKYAFSM